MKTLHIETGRHFYGGPQQVVYLMRGLAAKGLSAQLVCPPDSEIAVAANGEGIPVITIPCSGDLDLRFLSRLKATLRRERPDIVHCHSRRGADILGGRAAAAENIPAVVSRRVDNPDPGFLASLRYRPFCRVIAISSAIERELLNSGVEPSAISVIHSAVDVERFRSTVSRQALCREFALDDAEHLVASAAQFIPRKGHRYLLDALAALKGSYPRLRAVLFGRGPEEDRLRQRVSAQGLEGVVSFAGFREDLDDWLGGFDLLVHTAVAEGLGVIVLKAQAAGVPVVAFDAGGVPEVVEHDGTGLLVPPADSKALTGALAALLDDTSMRARFARNAKVRVAARFSIDAMVDAHVRLYEEVLRER